MAEGAAGRRLTARDAPPQLGPIVETVHGKVRGHVVGGIHTFRGLRYGASTGGANRFRPPQPPEPWTGVRQGWIAAGGYTAPQIMSPPAPPLAAFAKTEMTVSEDCLWLNLFTPALTGKRPVMLWVHGGGYNIESGTAPIYDGTNLARLGDVVVMTVNHRLGPFGHLYLADLLGPDYADSGNAGTLDLIAALTWIRDNIAAFGGDPGNVTVFGQSGGGGKIAALMVSPQAKGLFHKLIVQSGATLRLGTLDRSRAAANRALEVLGLTPATARQILTVPMERLLAPAPPGQGGPGGALISGGGPVVDGRVIPRHPFDPDAPEMSAHVPLLIGSNRTEMTLIGAAPATFALDEAGLRARLAPQLDNRLEPAIAAFRANRPKASPSDLYFEIVTWLRTTRDTLDVAELRAARGGAPTYLYQFTWPTPVEGGRYRTPHYLELPFVFNNLRGAESLVGDGPELQPMADRFGLLWTSFARTGVPSAPRTPAWPAFTLDGHETMMIDTAPRLVRDPFQREREAMKGVAAAGPGR